MELDVVCPHCGRRRVNCLVPSLRGAYCRCPSCGHMWQQAGLAVSSHRRRSLSGRRTDRGVDELVGLVQQLRSRIAELEAENAQLRDSANTFGDLAERLNGVVRGTRSRGRLD